MYTLSTGYTVCTPEAGEDYSAGYVIRYVNDTYLELNKEIVTDNAGTIFVGATGQVILGSYAEERYSTLASEMARYNAGNGLTGKDAFTLAQIAQTMYVKYTAKGTTYVVFSANSGKVAAKRTAFVDWVDDHPAP